MTNDNHDPLDNEKTIEQPASEHGSFLLSSGQSLGQYKIIRPLGRGGMGEVYEVENAVNRKRVALKVLPRSATGGSFVDRFRIESRVMSDLRHPHIVEVLHTGEENGLYYLTMDLVTGPEGEPQSLEELLKDEGGKLKAEAVRDCALQILDALEYAHARDVVHRDLKPANILVSDDGTLKVTDFGLAKVVGGEYLKSVIDRSISLSMAGEVSIGEEETVVEGKRPSSSARALLGTYDYMAPEQKSGGEITVRTDIYAFGVMLYRMLTGRKPEGRAKPVSHYGVSRQWDRIVDRCLEHDPADRFASASELRREIERVSGRGRVWKPLAVAAGLAGLVLLGVHWFSQSERTRVEPAPPVSASAPVVPQAPAIVPVAAVVEAEAVEVRFSVKPAGARVSVFSDRGLVAQQQTDAQGEFTVQLTPGSYEFEAQLDGYQLYAQRLQVDEAMSREIELVPLRGALTVLTTPGAEVTAKGASGTLRLGKADAKGELRYERLVEGDYELTMTHKDYQPVTARVSIATGRPQQVRQILKGKPGSIYISASPQAGVWVDGERKGSTGEQIRGLEPGERKVEVRLSGFRTERFTLEVPPNAQAPRKVQGNLVRESGRIQVEAKVPDYAREFFAGAGKRVRIGNGAWKSVTTLPYIEEGAACEEHEVRLQVAGFRVEPEMVRSRVEDEKTATARFILTPEPARLTVEANVKGVEERSGVGGLLRRSAESNAPGAEVFDSRGNRLGMAGTAFDVPSLQPVGLVVRASGYADKTEQIGAMEPGKSFTRRVVLEEQRLPPDLVEVSGAGVASLSGLAPGSSEAQSAQKAAVSQTGLPLEVRSAKTGIEFRLVPAGRYTRGSPKSEQDQAVSHGASRDWVNRENPQHSVTISKPFYCGKYPVTQAQWERVMGSNPSHFKNAGGNAPVESVSWEDTQQFLRRLCELEGVPQGTYRLLTEAQWEYACRAGTQTPFYFGDRLDSTMANFDGNYPYGGASKGPYRQTTTPVGQFRPNAFGLHDMIGNVWEWVHDWYGDYSSGSVTDPPGPSTGSHRVFRGGSWYDDAWRCRSAFRIRITPGSRSSRLGFRLQRTVPTSLNE